MLLRVTEMSSDATICEGMPPFDEDIRLMVKAQRGDRQAYARLYERYAPTVRRYIAAHNGRAESREDLVQEVFTRVWEHRDRYRPGMAVCPYLLGFAKNVHREHQARACREIGFESCELGQATDDENMGPEAAANRNDLAERVKFHLAQLPSRQRQALELVYLIQMPVAEAAKMMNCSTGALWQNLSEGRQRLKTALFLTGEESESI